jgi:hypothetical protein
VMARVRSISLVTLIPSASVSNAFLDSQLLLLLN